MALKEILAKFGFEIDDKPLKKADKDVDSFAKKVVTAFAAAEIVNGIKGFVLGMMQMEGQITDTAEALGIGRGAFQEWSYIASRGGASAEDMATSFKILQKNAVDGGAAFKKLGVDVKGADGQIRPVEALMNDVADGLANVENPAERTKLALELLGKGGTKLLPILSKGGKELEALRARFKELGGGLSEEALDGIGAAADALDDVELASTSLKGNLMLALAPALRWVTNIFASVIAYFSKGENAATRMKSALIVMGAVGAAAGLAMLKPYLPFLATIAAIYLIVQDFYTFLKGGDSVTGKILEWMFGKEGAEDIRGKLNGLGEDVRKFKKELEQKPGGGTIFDWLEEGFSRAGADLVKFVVDDIPEAMSFATDGRITNIWSTIGTSAVWALINAMTGGIPELTVQMWQGAMRTVDQVKDGLSGLADIASEAIGDMIDGLVNGLDGALERVKKATVNLITGGIKTPMRDTLQEKSPSKLSFGSAVNVGRGLIGGLAAMGPQVFAATRQLTGNIGRGLPVTSNTRNINVTQSNSMRFDVSAPSAAGMVASMRSSMTAGLDDGRRALEAALAAA